MDEQDVLEEVVESLRAEIQWRESLLGRVFDDGTVTIGDIVYLHGELRRKENGDIDLRPAGDNWARIRAKDILRERGLWDEDIDRFDTTSIYDQEQEIPYEGE